MTEGKTLSVKQIRGREMGTKRGIATKGMFLLGLGCFMAGCSGMTSRGDALQVGLSDLEIDKEAVRKVTARLATPQASSPEALPDTVKILFSFLGQIEPGAVVETKPHADAHWRLDRIYLLDDCVAAQYTEGHYMETVFFVRTRTGWRLVARIQPKDHL
jgi:hypothetical protein